MASLPGSLNGDLSSVLHLLRRRCGLFVSPGEGVASVNIGLCEGGVASVPLSWSRMCCHVSWSWSRRCGLFASVLVQEVWPLCFIHRGGVACVAVSFRGK